MLINYVAVYGKVEDWYNSASISGATLGAVLALMLFIKRELSVKRPVLDLAIFKKLNLTGGLILFLLLSERNPRSLNFVMGWG